MKVSEEILVQQISHVLFNQKAILSFTKLLEVKENDNIGKIYMFSHMFSLGWIFPQVFPFWMDFDAV